jgi:hypothetical protein
MKDEISLDRAGYEASKFGPDPTEPEIRVRQSRFDGSGSTGARLFFERDART